MTRRPYPTRLLAALLGLACVTAGSSLLLAAPAEAGDCSRQALADQGTTTSSRAASAQPTNISLLLDSAATTRYDVASWFTALVTPSEATGEVRFTHVPLAGPQACETIELGTVSLSEGVAPAEFLIPSFGSILVKASYLGSEEYSPSASQTVALEVNSYVGQVLITELRGSGPGGPNDSYVELYNNGPDVPLGGFRIQDGTGITTTVPSSAGTLGAGRSYLVTGSQYSLGAVATPDYPTGAPLGTNGFKVTAPDTFRNFIDAVGPIGGFRSGTGLPVMSGAPGDQYAWVRNELTRRAGSTNDNATNFHLVSTTGGSIGGVQSTLGSPSPTSTTSLYQHNDAMQSTLLDSGVDQAAAPNRIYMPGSPGHLIIQRTITNTSKTATIARAKLRVTALSEADGAPQPGVVTQPISHANLRIISPTTMARQREGVQTLVLDPPTDDLGGGLNSTMTMQLGEGLAPDASIDIAVMFEVDSTGSFWFGYDIDAASLGIRLGGAYAATATRRPVSAPSNAIHGVL